MLNQKQHMADIAGSIGQGVQDGTPADPQSGNPSNRAPKKGSIDPGRIHAV
jgi:hypothetical protein